MGYSNRFTGAITITPPLTWSDIQNGPTLKDVQLCVREEKRTAVVDGAEAEVIVRTADAIVPLDMEYSGHRLEEDIQAVIDHYEGYGFAGYIEAQWDPGFGEPPSRFIVKDDRVMRIDAQYRWPGIWPDEQPQDERDAQLADLAAELDAANDNADEIAKQRSEYREEIMRLRAERDEARELACVSLDILKNVSDEPMRELYGVDDFGEMPEWFTGYGKPGGK